MRENDEDDICDRRSGCAKDSEATETEKDILRSSDIDNLCEAQEWSRQPRNSYASDEDGFSYALSVSSFESQHSADDVTPSDSTQKIRSGKRRGPLKQREIYSIDQNDESNDEENDIIRRLTSLQLPRMPRPDEIKGSSPSEAINKKLTSSETFPKDPPTIRILIVADVDLKSASALAESALSSSSTSSLANPILTRCACFTTTRRE